MSHDAAGLAPAGLAVGHDPEALAPEGTWLVAAPARLAGAGPGSSHSASRACHALTPASRGSFRPTQPLPARAVARPG